MRKLLLDYKYLKKKKNNLTFNNQKSRSLSIFNEVILGGGREEILKDLFMRTYLSSLQMLLSVE